MILESSTKQQATHKCGNESTAAKKLRGREASYCQTHHWQLYPGMGNPLTAVTKTKEPYAAGGQRNSYDKPGPDFLGEEAEARELVL